MPDTVRICCPMCGWWRTSPYGVSAEGETREVRFDKVDPATAFMYRREKLTGAGRASKNAKIETLETRGLSDLSDELKQQIRSQCHRILEALGD